MLTIIAAAALAQMPAPAVDEQCKAEQGCVHANAAQLFALADKLYEAGDVAGAAGILEALTKDATELRAEARFRLAALREKAGDLAGAAQALRELLAEQPDANPARLELARILAAMGNKEARKEIASAERAGLPPEVEQNVRRFASAIPSASGAADARDDGRSGFEHQPVTSAQRSSTPSSRRSSSIADARRQSGIGFSARRPRLRPQPLGDGSTAVPRRGARGSVHQAALQRHPGDVGQRPRTGRQDRALPPAALYERRWYGGHAYSTGYGASLDWLKPVGPNTQLELSASRGPPGHPAKPEPGRLADIVERRRRASARAPTSTARLSLRYAALDARVRPESLRQMGADLLLAKRLPTVTAFVDLGYTRTRGLAPLFLFGKTRHD